MGCVACHGHTYISVNQIVDLCMGISLCPLWVPLAPNSTGAHLEPNLSSETYSPLYPSISSQNVSQSCYSGFLDHRYSNRPEVSYPIRAVVETSRKETSLGIPTCADNGSPLMVSSPRSTQTMGLPSVMRWQSQKSIEMHSHWLTQMWRELLWSQKQLLWAWANASLILPIKLIKIITI